MKSNTATKSITIKGTIYYARVHIPFDDGNYSVAFLPEDDAVLSRLSELGVPIKDANDTIPEAHVTASTKLAPTVVDADLETIPTTTLIGNGSTGYIRANIYHYKPMSRGQTGVKLTLEGIQVTDLVPFRNPLAGFTKQAGYKTTKDTNSDVIAKDTKKKATGMNETFDDVEHDPFADDVDF